MSDFKVGQRWMSETEPELGLGVVENINSHHVTIHFTAGDVMRQYAIDGAPVKRIQFRVGDQIKTGEGATFIIDRVENREGLLTYSGEGKTLIESEICHSLSFDTPEERLLAGHVDDFNYFDLRYETLKLQYQTKKSSMRGFLGGRVDLIPHQFYLTHEVASRQIPRVLLADEVGLGKTIEACLIMHRLLLSGQMSRVLILLPSALVHQWFVELLRRFNLSFHIFDQEHCESSEENALDQNPFLDYQLGLCSISFLKECPKWREKAIQAGWDMVIVDEAHHLAWSEESPSEEYEIVESFARQTQGLLLLTATPEQLGPESHFARLRLLDPNRYSSYEKFSKEENHSYEKVGQISETLLSGGELSSEEEKVLEKLIPKDATYIQESFKNMKSGTLKAKKEFVNHLLDQHGMGRVMFRNTRKMMKGFPKRMVHLEPFSSKKDLDELLKLEFESDSGNEALKTYDYNDDERIDWLVSFLRKNPQEKVLLICRYKEKVLAIEKALQEKIKVKAALFHEDLPLIRRDRNAAWFAEDDGATLLICSEIGSEGRNFQFAHHLILFDLPLDQELLEQRIGRLDRIGQTQEIHIHVPYYKNSPQEILAHWYHEGLQAFEHNSIAGCFFDERFDEPLKKLALSDSRNESQMNDLVAETKSYAKKVSEKLEKGRDRLLELNSFRPDEAKKITQEISKIDRDDSLKNYMEKVFDRFGIHSERLNEKSFLLCPGHLFDDSFPGIKQEGQTMTYDRETALSREDIQFLTWDHPMVTGAMELVLGSETGNSCVALWPSKNHTLLLEAVFVLECLAPPELYVERFFPGTPIRIIVNQQMEDFSEVYGEEEIKKNIKEGKHSGLMDEPGELQDLMRKMLEHSHVLANQQVSSKISEAHKNMQALLSDQIGRLRDLQKINDHVTDDEVQLAIEEMDELNKVILSARLRLDSLRVIWKSPVV